MFADGVRKPHPERDQGQGRDVLDQQHRGKPVFGADYVGQNQSVQGSLDDDPRDEKEHGAHHPQKGGVARDEAQRFGGRQALRSKSLAPAFGHRRHRAQPDCRH